MFKFKPCLLNKITVLKKQFLISGSFFFNSNSVFMTNKPEIKLLKFTP